MGRSLRSDEKQRAYDNLADAIQEVVDITDGPPGMVAGDFVVIVGTSCLDEDTGRIMHHVAMFDRDDNQPLHRTVGLLISADKVIENGDDDDED